MPMNVFPGATPHYARELRPLLSRASLAPGTSLTVDVTYSGAAAGQHDGTIDLTHNGSGQPRIFLRATL